MPDFYRHAVRIELDRGEDSYLEEEADQVGDGDDFHPAPIHDTHICKAD